MIIIPPICAVLHAKYICMVVFEGDIIIWRYSMEYKSKRMDHLGIVAAVCKEIGLVERIDNIIIPNSQQKVTTGEAVMAMVINALGFVSKPLYLFPDFMDNKAIGLFFNKDLRAEDFNDDTLGRALDRIYENDPTNIFMQVSLNVVKMLGIKRKYHHLDTTSISVHGGYKNSDEDIVPISITYGKPKNKRTDLKQYIISLITVSEWDLPVWIDTLSGNTSDKTHFRDVIKNYAKQLAENDEKVYFVVDSAGYTKENIREMPDIVIWLSRVPETITMAKELITATEITDLQKSNLEGYWLKSFSKTYGDIKQKWVVVFSEQSFKKETHTLDRNIVKERKKVKNELWHFGNKEFKCKKDAKQALDDKEKKWKYHQVVSQKMVAKKKTGKRGRPKKNAKKPKTVYCLKALFEENIEAIEGARKRKGKFILATNDMDLDAETILLEYKGQQSVERGFRFLKDPMFFASSTFLKKPQRIASLVMIMGLSLLIYSIAQRKLRMALEEMNETIPDQKGKPSKRPTMKRVFQMFEGIELLEIFDGRKATRRMLNVNEMHRKILNLMGESYAKMYFYKRGCGR